MDAVLTVANTTVHGAAGAGIKTAVLLSKTLIKLVDEDIEQGCYWYEGVDVFKKTIRDGVVLSLVLKHGLKM